MAEQAPVASAPEVSPQILALIQAIVREVMAAASPPAPKYTRSRWLPESSPSGDSEDSDDCAPASEGHKRPWKDTEAGSSHASQEAKHPVTSLPGRH